MRRPDPGHATRTALAAVLACVCLASGPGAARGDDQPVEHDAIRGTVAPAERDDLLAEIEAKLLSMRDPRTGELIVEQIYRRDDVYDGPFVGQAPDLLIVWRGWRYHVRDSLAADDSVFCDAPHWGMTRLVHAGQHRPEGILVMQGPGVRRGGELGGARLIDLAPTLLCLAEASIPAGHDGRVLTEVLAPSFFRESPPRYGHQDGRGAREAAAEPLSPEDEAAVWSQLRDLGYVE